MYNQIVQFQVKKFQTLVMGSKAISAPQTLLKIASNELYRPACM